MAGRIARPTSRVGEGFLLRWWTALEVDRRDDVSATPAAPEADGVDVALIRRMLLLSLEERLAVLQGFVDSIGALIDAPSDA